MSDLGIRIRVDLGAGRAIGPGKIALLESLDRTGSLSKAARSLGMSYRRAWLLLKSLNELSETPLATSTKGGAGGGGASLTPAGRAVIEAFRSVEATALRSAQAEFAQMVVASQDADVAGIRRLPPSREAAPIKLSKRLKKP